MAARARGSSIGDGLKTPHTVSLKVLRLTRPSLAQQFPIPQSDSIPDVPFRDKASLAYPHDNVAVSDKYILTPLLNLPESFLSAYVGETFSCTLSANNELPAGAEATHTISGVRIAAEIITPSTPSGRALELQAPEANLEAEAFVGSSSTNSSSSVLRNGASLQRILSLNLQEEGEHTLAVLVTYTETALVGAGQSGGGGGGGRAIAGGGKVRTFRKLYQFIAANLVSVRTKAGNMPNGMYALEAQLENMGERSIVLDGVTMNTRPRFRAHSLNWDMHKGAGEQNIARAPVLNARDIIQVAFLLEPDEGGGSNDNGSDKKDMPLQPVSATDGRVVLGQLSISWRSAMGDRGSISTGWLTARPK